MGKLALLAILGFGIFETFHSLNIQGSQMDSQERAADYQYEVLARSTALAGYIQAREHLRSSFSNEVVSGTFGDGAYDLEVSVEGDRAEVTSVATATDGKGTPTTYTITAQFQQTSGSTFECGTGTVPAFMDYLVLTDKDLRLSGNNGAAYVYASGDEGAVLNANMHTNKKLTVNGTGNKKVEGFGTYVTSASGKHKEKFTPHYNPNGLSSTYKTSTVSIGAYDPSSFAERLPFDQTTEGDLELSGTLNLGGTCSDPYVWYVTGNLTADGDLTINGYVLFVVDGNVTLNSVTAANPGYSATDESSIGFYACGSITIQGNATVWGQFYTADDFTMGGNPTLYGSITARGDVWIYGNPTLWYRKASTALTKVWDEVTETETVVELVAYHEH